jgi:general secretion pathway protein G
MNSRVTLVFLITWLTTGACWPQKTAEVPAAATTTTDKIVFKNGTLFEGQIIEGSKTLVDDPNRYEIILKTTGQTLSIEDTGQIEAVLMDGISLEDPLHRGGRGKLLDMLRQYREKHSAVEQEEQKKSLSAVVDWIMGEASRLEAGSKQPSPLSRGGRIFSGEEVQTSPAGRLRLQVAGRLQLGMEQGTNLRIKEILNNPETGRFAFEFALVSGSAWMDAPATPQKTEFDITTEGLHFRMSEGIFRLESNEAGDLILSHFRGPEVTVERVVDGQTLACPSDTRFTFSKDLRQSKGAFNPVRERIDQPNLWLEFTAWKPVESNVPIQFTLIGKPKMAPHSLVPILGLSSEKFVFQDLQPVAISGLAPMLQAYRAALRRFEQDVGRPPTEEEGLDALRNPRDGIQNWKGPYLGEEVPALDPWKHPLRYSVIDAGSKKLINLYSAGENGTDEQGLGDDLR